MRIFDEISLFKVESVLESGEVWRRSVTDVELWRLRRTSRGEISSIFFSLQICVDLKENGACAMERMRETEAVRFCTSSIIQHHFPKH